MQKLIHFIKYNNAIPILLGALFLGATATFAAVNPEIVYTEEETVVSIDNTYIAEKNLDNYTPEVVISDVTEDDENYYVEYKLTTIALADDVWQDVDQVRVMNVSKADLGQYRDLGVYVSLQLKQLIDREVAILKETQGFEKAKVTQKTIATKYGGLIGKLMDDTTEALEGYNPVVDEQEQDDNALLAESKENNKTDTYIASAVGVVTQPQNEPLGAETTSPLQVPQSLSFQILGNNPVHVPLDATYFDLGVMLVSDGKIIDYLVQTFLDDVEMEQIVIDASESAEYVITYKAQDSAGNVVEASRTVLVGDAEVSEVEEVTEDEDEPEVVETPTTTETELEEETTETEEDTETEQTGEEEEQDTTPAEVDEVAETPAEVPVEQESTEEVVEEPQQEEEVVDTTPETVEEEETEEPETTPEVIEEEPTPPQEEEPVE